jgi:hypothetical protein
MTMQPEQIKQNINESNKSKPPGVLADAKGDDPKAVRNNINMEAYQAYYNTNEVANAANEA